MTLPNKPPSKKGNSEPPKISVSNSISRSTTDDIDSIQRQIDVLTIRPINLNTDITGFIETVSAVPTDEPSDFFDQFKIYSNGSTYRLYWYDTVNHAWRYATGA